MASIDGFGVIETSVASSASAVFGSSDVSLTLFV